MTFVRRATVRRTGLIGCAALVALGAVSIADAEPRNPLKLPSAQYEPIKWAQIEGWAEDDHDAAFAAFLISCKAILGSSRPLSKARPMTAALHDACSKAVATKPSKPGEARAFFEENFRPVRISPLGDPDGFITGYYEPIVEGVRKQTDGFDYPLYRKPPGLLVGGRMTVGVAGASKGKKKAKRRRVLAFYDRSAIDDGGALAGRDLEICWLKDPIDAFFAHIQGSVRVRLEDGEILRLNYQAANGHPYVAVGKFLIQRNIISKDEMSMDRIREWMERNPEEGKELRRRNKSYVFFRQTNLASNEEPPGAQGIALTPGRSIAVDRHLHTYGTPFFISAMLPIETLQPTTPFRRLMIAQDTGGAILGPARADIYFGAGDEAGSVSGRLRHNGRFVMLVPNGMYVAAPEETPVPRPRPPGQMLPDQVKQEPDSPAVAAKASATDSAETKPAEAKSTEIKRRGSKTAAVKPDAKAGAKKPDKTKGNKAAAFDRHSVASVEVKPPPKSAKQPEKKSADKKSEKKSDKKQAHKRKSKSDSKS